MADAKRRIKAVEETAHEKIEKTRDAVNEGLDTAQEKVRTAADSAAASAAQLEEAARRASDAVKERYEETVVELRRGYERLRQEVEDVSKNVDRSVRHHPWETAAVAVGAGFLAGFLVGRLGRSSRG